MNVELAQIIALITHGNEYLSSPRKETIELFPSHSTFQYVAEVSFQKENPLVETIRKHPIPAKDTHNWFSYLETEGVKHLKLDVLNLQHLSPPYTTSIFTAVGVWVIQADMGKCWQAKWSFRSQRSRQARIWKVDYWESENVLGSVCKI